MLVQLLLTLFIGLSATIGDVLVNYFENHHLTKALTDNATHAIIGGLTWLTVQFHTKTNTNLKDSILEIALCTAVSSIIDVDHFIAAKSFNIQDVHRLKGRPFLHCTTLIVVICSIIIGISLMCDNQKLHTLGWIVCAASVSHHTRDATRRGYWFYPFGSTPPVNYWLYIFFTIVLPNVIAFFLVNFRPKDQNIVNVGNVYSVI